MGAAGGSEGGALGVAEKEEIILGHNYQRDMDITSSDIESTMKRYDFPDLLRKFCWAGESLELAWKRRKQLQSSTVSWINMGFPPCAGIQVADNIYKWGYGGKSFPAQKNDWELHSEVCISALLQDRAKAAAYGLLKMSQHSGIATISKLLCFTDQSRFGIFDSRVAFALRFITEEEDSGHVRKFPVPSWRASQRLPTGDSCVSKNIIAARAFDLFQVLGRSVADQLGSLPSDISKRGLGAIWLPAHVEMALFMAGKERNQNDLTLPISRKLYPMLSTNSVRGQNAAYNKESFARHACRFVNEGINQKTAIERTAQHFGLDPEKDLPKSYLQYSGSVFHRWRQKGWC